MADHCVVIVMYSPGLRKLPLYYPEKDEAVHPDIKTPSKY
jgi:hypothetical protein